VASPADSAQRSVRRPVDWGGGDAQSWTGTAVFSRGRNAVVPEMHLFDCLEFSDRSAVLHVSRAQEFAPIQLATGLHSRATALGMLSALHTQWVLAAAGIPSLPAAPELQQSEPSDSLGDSVDLTSFVEISPLVSFEGEDLDHSLDLAGGFPMCICGVLEQRHVRGGAVLPLEVPDAAPVPTDDRLDYISEYPDRPGLPSSIHPRFGHLQIVSGQAVPVERPMISESCGDAAFEGCRCSLSPRTQRRASDAQFVDGKEVVFAPR